MSRTRYNVFIHFLFQIVCNTCFFMSMLFAIQMTQKLLKLTRKNEQGQVLHVLLPKDWENTTFRKAATRGVLLYTPW